MVKNYKLPIMVTCATLLFNTIAYADTHSDPDDYMDINPVDKPNVVLILADDLGFTDLGVFGSEIQTPNIDQLANEGVMFSNFHASASCAPSRAMLLTGVDNHLAGVSTIPESMPPEQADEEHYEGVLSDSVATVASLLYDEGYHTYMTGKWHLGKEKDELPFNRGFEQTLSMADTGADNWEQRPYMPIYDHAHWTRNGEEIQLDQPFYSSELIVDEMIEYIDSNLDDNQPFFSYVSFLAVHMPVQAPAEYTDMYMETYVDGWEALRNARHESAMSIGLVPESTQRVTHEFLDDWDVLSESEQAYEAKRMAVYAGMVTAMDDQIGRLVEYLDQVGELENTIFIITSDNGPEYSFLPEASIESMGYTTDYDTLGEIGSFNYIDKNFANAAASPLSYFKFYAGEGGLRVPLIISGQGIAQQDGFNHAFTHITDITPTILSLTGTEPPEGRYGGRTIYSMTGKDLTSILKGEADKVYSEEDYVGYEVAGNIALFNMDYKLVMNRGPLGDSEWYLYDIVNDPGETKDLKDENPVQFQKMLNLYQSYARENGVQAVPEHYSQDVEIGQKMFRNSRGDALVVIILVAVTVSIFWLFAWQRKKLTKGNRD